MRPKTMFLLLLPVIVIGLVGLSYNGFSTDEYTYLNSAQSFHQGQAFGIADPSRFPLYPFALSLVYDVVGENELAARLFNLFIGCLTVIVVTLLVNEIAGEEAGFFAGLLTSSAPLLLFLDTRLLTEPLFILTSTAMLYAIYKSGKDPKWLVPTGILQALVFLSRYTGLYLALVAAVYVFYKRGFERKTLVWACLGALAFLVVLSPWLYYSQTLTGSPLGLFEGFLRGQEGSQTNLALPDKIPSYLPVVPFLLGFASFIWAWSLGWLLGKWREPNNVFLLSSFLVPTLTLEAIGLFHPDLLRYVAPLSPVLAIIFAITLCSVLAVKSPAKPFHKTVSFFQKLDKFFRSNWKRLVYLAVILNVVVAVGVVVWFGQYHKHVAYRQVGEFVATSCTSVYSNIPNVLQYYTHKDNTQSPNDAQCFVYSPFEGSNFNPPGGYSKVFAVYGVTVYKKTV